MQHLEGFLEELACKQTCAKLHLTWEQEQVNVGCDRASGGSC